MNSSQKYDPIRERIVLLEKISSDVKTVAEGYNILNRKIDRIDLTLSKIKADLRELKTDIKEIKEGQIARQ